MGSPFSSIRIFFLSFVAFALFLSQTAQAIDFAAHGYYRTRGNAYQNLDLQSKYPNHRFGLVAFNQMRLRVQPMVKFNDYLSLFAEFDVFDNLLFGTRNTEQLQLTNPVVGTITMPAGAASVSMTGGDAGTNKTINFRRAWMDVLTPVGQLRIGRQPSQWGLGIFQNDGNELQGDFGDSADRVMFITGSELDDDASISGGILWDIAFEAQYDPRIENFTEGIAANGKGTQQYAGFVLYQRPEAEVGLFGGIRRRSGGNGYVGEATNALGTSVPAGLDGKTFVYFADLYAKYSYNEYDFRFEGVYLGGKISTGLALDAVPFSSYSGISPTQGGIAGGIIEMPTKQDIQVFMAAFEASGAYKWGGEWNLKTGFAEGDASPLSQRITQYGFRPDYQIGLLMFHEPMGTSPSLYGCPATNPGCGTNTSKLTGGVPITGNNINNAIYVATGYKHHFDIKSAIKECNDFAIGGTVLTAWADKNPVELNFQSILENAPLPILSNSHKWYGFEVDAKVEAEFFDHLYTSLEGGFLFPGAAYNISVNGQTLGTLVQAIPYSKAEISYGGRLTLSLLY
ncbi:MAG: hypothetical protein COV46_05825 [Deltaproteobacteria bacterium CG11_big_fil_rev_8_21_14_0_20_49_13]|nr:MAG: hypothetical protein COV46_05825 [Deltaproteobacteria bacterium CG11_big_fil_rev_8_21_14_0_20_49_13]